MHPYKRSQRVADLIKEVIADAIQQRLKDPRVGFVTVTGVDLTEDLKLARIYVSILKEEERQETIDILNEAKNFFRSEVAKNVRMKYTPAVEFRLDTSIEYGDKIERLLRDIKEQH